MAVPHTPFVDPDSMVDSARESIENKMFAFFVTWIHVLQLTAFQDWNALENRGGCKGYGPGLDNLEVLDG